MSWRNHIDPSIKSHLEVQINETARHRKVFSKAEKPSEAQLWVAVANLSKQLFDLNLRLKFLEQVMQESLGKKAIAKKPITKKKIAKKKAKRK